MTAKRVREIFGDRVAEMGDKEINLFIESTSTICDELLVYTRATLTQKLNRVHTEQVNE